MKTTDLPDAEINRNFMDGIRDLLGMDPISHHSFSKAAKEKHAKGVVFGKKSKAAI